MRDADPGGDADCGDTDTSREGGDTGHGDAARSAGTEGLNCLRFCPSVN